MECFADHGFLEELLALRTEPWQEAAAIGTEPPAINEFCYSSGWPLLIPPPSIPVPSFWENTADPTQNQNQNPNSNYCSLFTECYFGPFGDELSPVPELTELNELTKLETTSFPSQDDLSCIMNCGGLPSLEFQAAAAACGVEPGNEHGQHGEVPVFNIGSCPERQSKPKKLTGQPSKNLMAERRRRKRLNDRLSMLRSVVPKISKMDRTAILGDTIDYMKELLERINGLQEEEEAVKKVVGSNSNPPNLMGIFRDVKPNEVLVRNSPKFNVERDNSETRIDICCAGKPGLLLSTLTTLDALGLEIQQCVLSCFNDFSLHASCSEEMEKRGMVMSSEDMKQALFRNAGYGGRCF